MTIARPIAADDEAERLAELDRYHLLDTQPDEAFDELVRLASTVCGTPIALVSLIDATRQWFKARVGLDVAETSRDVAFCAHTILGTDIMVVPDAHLDARFKENPLVLGAPHIRFYAGVPLTTVTGRNMGTVCVIDRVPRTLRPDQEEALRLIGRQVVRLFDLGTSAADRDALLAFRAAMDAHSIVTMTAPDGTLTYANDRFLAVSKYARHEVIGRGHRDMVRSGFHPESFYDGMVETCTAGRVWRGEVKNRAKDGTFYWVDTTIIPVIGDGGAIESYITLRADITDRKQIEQELLAREAALASFKATLDRTFDCVFIFDPVTLRLTYCNRGACEQVGYAEAELLSMSIVDIKPRFTRESYLEMAAPLFDGTQPSLTVETVHRHKDGHEIPVEIVAQLVNRGEPDARFVTIVRDITERKSVEGERQQSQKLEAFGQLAAGIAHELNTPIQYVAANVQFLQTTWADIWTLLEVCRPVKDALERLPADPALVTAFRSAFEKADLDYATMQIPQAIDECLEGVDRVGKIVRAVKEFSHPGRRERAPADLNHAIETTITVARNEWKYAADVVTDFEPDLPPVVCLVDEFSRVILNLLINASHAIEDRQRGVGYGRGTITVGTRRVDKWVEVWVRDTGTGIPESARPRVFEPFFTTKPVGKGTGQGLSMAHSSIVHQHGGQIRFETETGVGTTFFVRLPLVAPADSPDATSPETKDAVSDSLR